MGMDPTVNIWIGVRDDDLDLNALQSEMESPVLDQDGDFPIYDTDKKASMEAMGFILRDIRCNDQVAGIGHIIFNHDWDYGVVEFDLEKIQDEVKRVEPLVRAYLEGFGVDPENIRVWAQTDYF